MANNFDALTDEIGLGLERITEKVCAQQPPDFERQPGAELSAQVRRRPDSGASQDAHRARAAGAHQHCLGRFGNRLPFGECRHCFGNLPAIGHALRGTAHLRDVAVDRQDVAIRVAGAAV